MLSVLVQMEWSAGMQKRASRSCKLKVDEQLDDLVLRLRCHPWWLGSIKPVVDRCNGSSLGDFCCSCLGAVRATGYVCGD